MTSLHSNERTIVCVEDDTNIADLVSAYLRKDGYRVLLTDNGESALEIVRREMPNLVILDIGLKGNMDGFHVCKTLRTDSNIPIIILTARDTEIDRVLGLEIGADDYITKPFSGRELCARVKALLRRAEPSEVAQPIVSYANITIDSISRHVLLDGREVDLTNQEFDLLLFLVKKRHVALTRRQILDGAWEPGWYGDERTVDVHIRQLRKKLGETFQLDTVWGVGYRLA